MQQLFRLHRPPLTLVAVAVLYVGCYAHAGSPYNGDSDRWFELAEDACERGDESAYATFIERSDIEAHTVDCRDGSIRDRSTADQRD